MADRWVIAWFYEQSAGEGGRYAQVRGDSSSESFRDVYRRCLAVFFATARRANPTAKLALYLNHPWRPEASREAGEIANLFANLGVEVRIIEYTSTPPSNWTPAWRNQFFILDVLSDLSRKLQPQDVAVILDSDISWSGSSLTHEMWNSLEVEGFLSYVVGYPTEMSVNGFSGVEMAAFVENLTGHHVATVPYSGGEFVGVRGDICAQVVEVALPMWSQVLERFRTLGEPTIDEAHLLSMTYARLGLRTGGADRFVKRMWTQPFKYRNVTSEDLALPLWHVPAEKKYGLRRMYRSLDRLLQSDNFLLHTSRMLGVPTNPTQKVIRDVATALVGRLHR